MGLIVIEGCDGTGKTTLANLFAAVLDGEIVHCTSQTPNNYRYFDDILRLSRFKNIIADRWMYGQFVYQQPFERKLSNIERQVLEQTMNDMGVPVILVEADEKAVQERLDKRAEKVAFGLNVHEVMERFRQVRSESMTQWVTYRTTPDWAYPKEAPYER